MAPHVLLVEDDPGIYEAIVPYARRDRWTLSWKRSVVEAQGKLNNGPGIDVVLIDRGLPGVSGNALARHLMGGALPFIMLTAQGAEEDRLSGFDLGADDYIVKPFSTAELMRRIEVVLRRRDVPRLRLGGSLEIDTESRTVRAGGRPLALTPTEYALLEQLARRPERVFTRAELVDLLHLDLDTSDPALDSHVKNLRKKLRASGAGERIETVIGAGYAWRTAPPSR